MKIETPEGFSHWNSAEHLKTEEDIRFYLDACLEEDEGDGRLIRHANSVVARAHGMAQLAKENKLTGIVSENGK